MTARWRRTLAAAIIVALAVGCAPADDEPVGLQVVATTSVLGDIAAEVVGDDGTVATLIPRGADPHDYQASPSQAASVRRADLVIAIGLGLEEGLERVLDAAAADGVPVLELAPHLDPIAGDPHIWLDPVRIAEGVHLIGTELARQDPDGDWPARAEAYAAELRSVHAEVADLLAAIPPHRRRLVSDHDSLRYLAERYDLEVAGTIVPGTSPLAAPAPRHLAALAALIREEGIPAVFLDEAASGTVAEALRREVGTDLAVVRLHIGSLGPADAPAGTYAGLLRENARRIADALGG